MRISKDRPWSAAAELDVENPRSEPIAKHVIVFDTNLCVVRECRW